MLKFASPAGTADGAETSFFHDEVEADLLHVLPAGLAIARFDDGAPCFGATRHRSDDAAGGGAVFLELVRVARDVDLPDGMRLRPVIFERARARVRGWRPVDGLSDPLGPWMTVNPAGATIFREQLLLDGKGIQMLEALLDPGSAGEIEVEAECLFSGLLDGISGIASISTGELETLFRSRVPSLFTLDGASSDAIAAAVLSAPGGPAFPFVVDGATLSSENEQLHRRLANEILATFLVPIDGGDPWEPRFVWPRDFSADDVTFSLAVRRRAKAVWRATWSLSDFARGLNDAERKALFPVSRVTPFGKVAILVIADDPIDRRFVRQVQVDVTHTDMGGVERETSFIYPGSRVIERFTARYPLLTNAFVLTATIAITLESAPAEASPLPRVLAAKSLNVEGHTVRWSLADGDVACMPLSAESDLFDVADALASEVFAGDECLCVAELTRDNPLAALAWPLSGAADPADTVRLTARRADDSVIVFTGHPSALPRIDASLLMVVSPVPVEVSLAPSDPAWFDLALIEIEDPAGYRRQWRLEPGVTQSWPCWPASLFDPLRYRWRLSYVPSGAPGEPRALIVSDWREGADAALVIADPGEAP